MGLHAGRLVVTSPTAQRLLTHPWPNPVLAASKKEQAARAEKAKATRELNRQAFEALLPAFRRVVRAARHTK